MKFQASGAHSKQLEPTLDTPDSCEISAPAMSGRKGSGATKASLPPGAIARRVLKQGNLEKKSSGLARRWQQRFFALLDGGVLVYRDQMDGEVRAWYNLRGASVETPIEQPRLIIVRLAGGADGGGAVVELRAPSAGGARAWLEALRAVMAAESKDESESRHLPRSSRQYRRVSRSVLPRPRPHRRESGRASCGS